MTDDALVRHSGNSFGTALYYPFISISDVNWLKSTLLYWDDISCIVPDGHQPEIAEEMKPAEDLVQALSPWNYAEAAEAAFRRTVLPLTEPDAPPEGKTLLSAVASRLAGRKIWIYIDKMTGNLRHELEGRGLLHTRDDKMFLSEGLDALYMICLSNVMANATGRPPLTDATEYAECQALLQFSDASTPRSAGQRLEHGSVLARLGFAMPSSADLAGIPLGQIVRYHEKRQAERRAFRKVVEETTARASELADSVALNDFLNECRRDIEEQISDYRKSLDEIGVGSFSSVLDVSVPLWAGSVGGAVAILNPAAGAAAGLVAAGIGISIKLIAWWANVRGERRLARSGCPWHYWMDTKAEFNGG
jgi:hypothetical protein